MNSNAFPYDVFLSHSAKDKPVVRPLAERLRQDGLKVPSAFGLRTSDFGFAQPGSFRFRYPLHQERRFIHWRLDDAPIKGSLAQFLYINWHPVDRQQEYAKLLEACRKPDKWPLSSCYSELLKQPEPATRNRECLAEGEHETEWTSCAHFFSNRFASSFPGIRDEVVWFSDANSIANRMERLLQNPLRVGNYSPIWWFRGLSSNSVERFRRLDSMTWLLNGDEVQIRRIAAAENRAYWSCFVYVEVDGVVPSGAYNCSEESSQQMLRLRGYCSEEVCLFRGRYLKRTFFDDGAAEIDGHLVDLGDEAELRRRYLSKYNFVLAGQDSATNNTGFEQHLHSLMNEILLHPASFDQLVQAVERLPKQVSFFNGGGPRGD